MSPRLSLRFVGIILLLIGAAACDHLSRTESPQVTTRGSTAISQPPTHTPGSATLTIKPPGAAIESPGGAAAETPTPAFRHTFFVSPEGDDQAQGGSPDTALQTIERALAIVQPGEAVFILPGVYHESLELYDAGSDVEPITLRGEGEGVVLDGQESVPLGIWCENCTNWVFENLEIRNYSDIGIGVSRSSDITMRNLTVHHNGFAVQLVDWEIEGYGISVDESQRITIAENQVFQNGPDPQIPDDLMGTGIDTFMCTDCVIRGNRSHDNIGGGILVEDGVKVLVEGNQIFANELDASVEEWWDGGIWVDGGHDIIVRDNLVRDNLGPGIQISDEDNQQPYGYVLVNNLSTRNYYGIYLWNFGTTGFPEESILRMRDNRIEGNLRQDIWIVDWECPPWDPCE